MRAAAILDPAAQPVVNRARNSSGETTTTGITRIGSVTGTALARDATRSKFGTSCVGFDVTGGVVSGGINWQLDADAATVGSVVRWRCWAYSSVATTVNPYGEGSLASTGAYQAFGPTTSNGGTGATNVPVPANTWTVIEASTTVGVDKKVNRVGFLLGGGGGSGQLVRGDGCVITVDQDLPELYVDGNTPGRKWLGTAEASASVGWPYTLDSIAGKKPLAEGFGAAQTIGFTNPGPFTGRTGYVVYDVVSATTDYSGIAIPNAVRSGFTSAVDGYMNLSHQTVVSGGTQWRIDMAAGTSNLTNPHTGTRTVGRHMAACSVQPQGGTFPDGRHVKTRVDAQVPAGTFIGNYGGGFLGDRLTTGVAGQDIPIYTSVYNGAHDTETMNRVCAFLARKYGAPIPAGY